MDAPDSQCSAPLEPPVSVPLFVAPPVPCPYLPGREETIRAVMASSIAGNVYTQFMDRGFRRSGRMIYQPVCLTCRACVQLRVLVNEFTMSKSQRRTWRRNADLGVRIDHPRLSDEKLALYAAYVTQWHDKSDATDRQTLQAFLYDSPTQSIEFEYRDRAGKLVAVGICDLGAASLSSVYFYFDPAEASRGLGTYGALVELRWCAERHLPYYYLGFWVQGCASMEYKANYRPHELLQPTGEWRRVD